MTVSDKMKVDLRIGNLNSFILNVRITTNSPSTGPISYSLPSGTFMVWPRSSVTRTIVINALNVTSETTLVSIAISAI